MIIQVIVRTGVPSVTFAAINMPSYHYEVKTIASLVQDINNRRIDCDPSYQREIVWDEKKQKGLVNTLLEQYPIPPLNFVQNNDPVLAKYECMDGKNRLQAIFLFVHNELTVNGRKFEDMSENDREDFKCINIQVCIFDNLTYEQRREYFRRIQEGVNLTQTEIMWSLEDKNIVVELRKMRERSMEYVSQLWDTKRYSDLTLLCNLAAMLMKPGEISKVVAGHSTALKNWIIKTDNDKNYIHIAQNVREIMKSLCRLLSNIQPNTRSHSYVVLDLGRVLIYRLLHDDSNISNNKIYNFIDELNQYMLNGVQTDNDDIIEYAGIIFEGGARQYSSRNTEKRFEICKKNFLE